MRAFSLLLLVACQDYTLAGAKEPPGTDTDDTPPDEDCGVDPLPGYPGPSDPDCASEVVVGVFDPVVEWEWSESATFPSYDEVLSTPAVGDLDGNGVPEVVFTAHSATNWNYAGTLVALSGDGTGVVFEVAEAGGYLFAGSGIPALGDLEGDGSPDICVPGDSVAIVCLESDGSFKWASGAEISHFGAPAIADLDGDGRAEVILGRQIFDAAGALVGLGTEGSGGQVAFWDGTNTALSFAANIDADADLEVVAGNAVYERDGSLVWFDGGADGFPAVADFDADGAPEVVKVVAGTVTLTDTDGTAIWSVVPGFGGNGGPPTVADFDGDGAPEIGVAGASFYMVLEADGTVLWQAPVVDYSSHMTGSAVFDFEGDGAAEVVYADEHTVWVFDGATGAVELEQTGHASATAFEYPVIADVDADGSAEIVVASNNSYYAGWGGIHVIGDATNSWRPGRPVWNQHAYSITNVDDDLGIPAVPEDNWARYNNFRSGDLATGFGSRQPDVLLAAGEVCEVDCDEGRLVVQVHPGNEGAVEAHGATVTLSIVTDDVETVVGTQRTGPIPAGAYTRALVFDLVGVTPFDRMVARILPDDLQCDDADDALVIAGPFCE